MARNRINIRPEEILGVARDATREEISRARGNLAKALHPDLHHGTSTAIMQLVNHAVEVLLSGETGEYSFGAGPGGPAPEPRRPRADRKTCTHPRNPRYEQCFACSGIRPCEICNTGYYRPPNDRCSDCRNGSRWRRK